MVMARRHFGFHDVTPYVPKRYCLVKKFFHHKILFYNGFSLFLFHLRYLVFNLLVRRGIERNQNKIGIGIWVSVPHHWENGIGLLGLGTTN